ncbi:MAG: DUF3089 domain-containing protein [Pseudomonadota bacterium]
MAINSTKPGARRLRPGVIALSGVLAALALAAAIGAVAVIFQDNLSRFALNPRKPFDTLTPPPRPSYGEDAAWALRPASPADDNDGTATATAFADGFDVFLVHGTTYFGREYWNAPIDEPGAEARLQSVALPNQAGPFVRTGRVYAPRYRQATQFAFFTQKYDGVAARSAAFADIDAAFQTFLADVADTPERPYILAGYGQGGLHVLGLLQKHFSDGTGPASDNASDKASEQAGGRARNRLAAAYVIGYPVAPEFFDNDAAVSACTDADDFRCVVSYVAYEPRFEKEAQRARKRSMTWTPSGVLTPSEGAAPLCINPLSWRESTLYIGPDRHVGAASATGLRLTDTPPPLPNAVGAQCIDGVLIVDPPEQDYLRRHGWFAEKWKPLTFNLFYYDLAQNAALRARRTAAQLNEEASILAPIDDAVEIGDSPVNKVPD